MKAFRAKRRPGNRAMTAAESALVTEAKGAACMPCAVWAEAGRMPSEHVATDCDWNHAKRGNLRRGHDKGYAGCGWHHRGLVGEGWTRQRMRDYFGPSLTDGSRLFHDTYGSDDSLIARQRELLGHKESHE